MKKAILSLAAAAVVALTASAPAELNYYETYAGFTNAPAATPGPYGTPQVFTYNSTDFTGAVTWGLSGGGSPTQGYTNVAGYTDDSASAVQWNGGETKRLRWFSAAAAVPGVPYVFSFAVKIAPGTDPTDQFAQLVSPFALASNNSSIVSDFTVTIEGDYTAGGGGPSSLGFYSLSSDLAAVNGQEFAENILEGGTSFVADGTTWNTVFVYLDSFNGTLKVWLNPTAGNDAPVVDSIGFVGTCPNHPFGLAHGLGYFTPGAAGANAFTNTVDSVKIHSDPSAAMTPQALFEEAAESYGFAFTKVSDWSVME